ncbi:MAG: GtrA family protein [bacterium]
MKSNPVAKLTFKYAVFALIATLTNIALQKIVFTVISLNYTIYLAMGVGTLAGLVVKYILDKKFIFYYKTKSIHHDLAKFILYTLMGVLTTVIFWSVELFFNYCFDFQGSPYLGAFIGLTIGYTCKYFLDRKFVFIN